MQKIVKLVNLQIHEFTQAMQLSRPFGLASLAFRYNKVRFELLKLFLHCLGKIS
jgi:hypothetical protein